MPETGSRMAVTASSVTGLTAAQVAERQAKGQVNATAEQGSRSTAHILRANVLTRFNAIITVLLVIVLAAGDPADALFGLVMVINAVIGIVQELRAKRTLDRLSVLSAPRATVLRDGEQREIAVEEMVLDDVLLVARGDQVPVDGAVLGSEGLQVDESLLTGESDPVDKEPGDPLMSGSFVSAGAGRAVATAVGEDAYARRLSAEAKRFTLVRSELRAGVDRILQIITWLLVPVGALVLAGELIDHRSAEDALVGMVAAVVGMIPQGLVLLVSLSFAVAVIRLGRRQALVQELPAVEVLARVDTMPGQDRHAHRGTDRPRGRRASGRRGRGRRTPGAGGARRDRPESQPPACCHRGGRRRGARVAG